VKIAETFWRGATPCRLKSWLLLSRKVMVAEVELAIRPLQTERLGYVRTLRAGYGAVAPSGAEATKKITAQGCKAG